MSEIVTTCMVISVMPIGEYDRRVELLSSGLGRISAFARGARKPGSPLVSATRVFAFGDFSLYRGRNSYTIRSAQIHHYFDELTQDMDHMFYGFYFLELAQYFSRENLEAKDMLKLLYYGLKALNHHALDNELVRSIVEIKILDLNGLCPHTFPQELSGGCLKAIRHVLQSPPEKLFSFALSKEVLAEFSGTAKKLLRLSVDREFRSEQLLVTQS